MSIFLNKKPAVKVNAKPVMWGATDKSRLYNIDGEEKWVLKRCSKYNSEEKTLIIEKWLYKRLFPNKS